MCFRIKWTWSKLSLRHQCETTVVCSLALWDHAIVTFLRRGFMYSFNRWPFWWCITSNAGRPEMLSGIRCTGFCLDLRYRSDLLSCDVLDVLFNLYWEITEGRSGLYTIVLDRIWSLCWHYFSVHEVLRSRQVSTIRCFRKDHRQRDLVGAFFLPSLRIVPHHPCIFRSFEHLRGTPVNLNRFDLISLSI
jgi:hypothetical protein